MNLILSNTAQAESNTNFQLNINADLIDSNIPNPKYLGNAILDNGITLPAYQIAFVSGSSDKEYDTQAPQSLVIPKRIKPEYQRYFAVYYFDDRWFLLPKNWKVVRAAVGANGSMALDFIPPSGQAGYFRYWTNNGGCIGCGVATASLFFQQADVINQNDFGAQPNYHNSTPVIQSIHIRPNTEAWRTSVNGQNIDGLAYFSEEEDYLTWTATVSLPKSQTALATPILNWFLPPKN